MKAVEDLVPVKRSVEIDGIGTVVTVDLAVLDRKADIVSARLKLGPVTEANFEESDALVGDYRRHNRAVEDGRKSFGRPFLDATKAINAAAAEASLEDEERAFVDEVAAVRRGIEAKARAAEAERARVAAEAQAKLEEAERLAAEQARELAALESIATDQDAPVIEELRREAEVRNERAQAAAVDAGGRAWLAAAATESRVVARGGAKTVMRPGLIIDDPDLIPRVVNGIECMVPAEAAISTLLRANVAVPGCRWDKKPHNTAGRR